MLTLNLEKIFFEKKIKGNTRLICIKLIKKFIVVALSFI